MADDFLTSSILIKRIMDFVGNQPSAVDAKIPGSGGTEFTRHGARALTRLSDGMSLEEALYALDAPWDVAVSSVQSSSWANLLLNHLRVQPVFVIGKVTRKTSRIEEVTFVDDFVATGGVDRYGNVTVTGSVSSTQNLTMWDDSLSTFELTAGATLLDTASILLSDSTALLIGTHSPAVGIHNYSLAHTGGTLGTLVETEIFALGANTF